MLTGGRRSSESGQAAVSFVAVVPLAVLAAAALVQAALVGHAAWAAADAARAAARAELVGSEPERAARGALPRPLAAEATVRLEGGAARVSVSAPRLLPALPRIELRAEAALAPEGSGGGD